MLEGSEKDLSKAGAVFRVILGDIFLIWREMGSLCLDLMDSFVSLRMIRWNAV